ncbi:hypothetical protein D3C85_517180 [compost metagenome]
MVWDVVDEVDEWEYEWIELDKDEMEYQYAPVEYHEKRMPHSRVMVHGLKASPSISSYTRFWDYKDKIVLNCVVANLIACGRKKTKLIYSRREGRCKHGISVYKVKKCVDWLEKEGYIVNCIGVGSAKVENRMPSYMEPTDKLLEIWQEREQVLAELRYLDAVECVELRDGNKEKVDYRSSKSIAHMNSVVKKLNKLNEGITIVDGSGKEMTNIYCRIFNETFGYGGRFYRADVLAIRNKDTDARLDIKIDSEEVVEVDYANLHFRIACALENISVECIPLDVYSGMLKDETNKIDRQIVKLAVNIMFNCSDDKTARNCIQLLINKLKGDDKRKYSLGTATDVMKLVNKHYPDFAGMFCNSESFGRVLQNHDSHLAGDILEVFIEKGIPCLPVHDSFICQKQYMDLLCDTMGDMFRKRFNVEWDVPVGVKYKDNGETVELKISV